jgi:hypothetical protein
MRSLAWISFFVLACGRTASSSGAQPADDAATRLAASYAEIARDTVVWEGARQGDPDEVTRLYHYEGVARLLERGGRKPDRMAVIAALAHAPDFTPFPWLADQAASGDDKEAVSALDSMVTLATRVRTTNDPEDADDLHDGCIRTLELARSSRQPKERRAAAVGILRMLVDRGCVKAEDIPTELD